MNSLVDALINTALKGSRDEEEALRALMAAPEALREKMRVEAADKARRREAADQPFGGGAEWLMHYRHNG